MQRWQRSHRRPTRNILGGGVGVVARFQLPDHGARGTAPKEEAPQRLWRSHTRQSATPICFRPKVASRSNQVVEAGRGRCHSTRVNVGRHCRCGIPKQIHGTSRSHRRSGGAEKAGVDAFVLNNVGMVEVVPRHRRLASALLLSRKKTAVPPKHKGVFPSPRRLHLNLDGTPPNPSTPHNPSTPIILPPQ